jgi:hypothetical protein
MTLTNNKMDGLWRISGQLVEVKEDPAKVF